MPWLAGAALLAGCHTGTPPRSVSEVPAATPVSGDPAVRGDWTQPLRLPPGAVPGHDAEHDFPDYASVHGDRFDLEPAAARDVPVAMSGASLIVAQAIAFGKAAPLGLAIHKNGVAAATATAVALPPDRTEATTAAEFDGTGAVTIHVANLGPDPVSVRLVVEIAPRGGH